MNQEQLQYSIPDETCSGIYKITFENGYYYIGSAINIKARCRDHISKSKRNKHENPIFQNTFLRHPKNILFEVLEKVPKEKLLLAEQNYLTINFGKPNCINICTIASKPPSAKGRKHTEKHKTYMSNKMKGRVLSHEWKQKIGQANKQLPNLVKRRRNLYNKRCKEIIILEEQRSALIEYFI